MLDFARSAPAAVGTNLKGEQADTSWLFCLPSLELERALVLGAISPVTLSALDPLCKELIVAGARPAAVRRLRRAVEARGLTAVAISSGPGAALLGEGALARLVWLDPDRARELAGQSDAVHRLEAVLESGGAVYVEPGRGGSKAAAKLASQLGVTATMRFGCGSPIAATPEPPPPPRSAWMIPASAASPTGLRRDRERLFRLLGRVGARLLRRGPRRHGAPVSEPDSALRVIATEAGPVARGAPPGSGVLLRPGGGQLPEYLRETAARGGIELDAETWSLAPPRGYRSQKVIFFTRTREGESCVVKLTQDPRYNRLLDNEARALATLEAVGAGTDRAIGLPRLLFEDAHAGLTMIGQTALSGRAFTSVSDGSPDCPIAAAALDAVTALGVATEQRGGAGTADTGEALGELLRRYLAIYAPAARERELLEHCVQLLGGIESALPAVFMHADTTVFNLLAGESGQIGMVDWENAEPTGMPLWDLLHFLQSYGAWGTSLSGGRYSPAVFRRQLLSDSPLSELLRRRIRSYCEALAIPAECVEPLFHSCWMQQAVREARQLHPGGLDRGLYRGILRAGIEASLDSGLRL